MNNIFNLNRFNRLFIKHTAEHYKSYLMSLTVLIGVLVLGGSFLVYFIPVPIDINLQTGLFVVILLLAGTIFTSTVFVDLGDKKKAVAALILPASHFEKYLVAWIYSFVIFLVIYTVSFYLIVLLLVNIKNFPNHPPEIFNVFERRFLQVYLLFAFLHAIALLGAVFFEKLQFIKTAFVFFISVAVLILFNKILLRLLIGREVATTAPFSDLKFLDKERAVEVNINITSQFDSYLSFLIMVLALLLWVASYYRLKEKQV